MGGVERLYSSFYWPFRLQLKAEVVEGFEGPASPGACQYEGCNRFEWLRGRHFCRDHWLLVHGVDRLPG